MTSPDDLGGWLLLPPDAVPARWRGRARAMMAIPLLPGEAAEVIDGGPVVPGVSVDDERLLRLIARGQSIAAAARAVGVPQRSAERRVARLRRELGISSTAELTAYLAKRGF